MIGCPPWQIPWSGRVTSWLILVIIVIAPTATSPPNLERLLVKLMDRRLSVDSITKVEIPRARHGPNTLGSRCMLLRFRRRIVFFPVRKRRIHTAPTVWLRTVASAAPFTPMPRAKIKIGSRIMLITAPIIVVIILILANPWVVMKVFMPSTISTKKLPRI